MKILETQLKEYTILKAFDHNDEIIVSKLVHQTTDRYGRKQIATIHLEEKDCSFKEILSLAGIEIDTDYEKNICILKTAIVYGVGFKIRHGMTGPYMHGYELTNTNPRPKDIVAKTDGSMSEVINKMYKALVENNFDFNSLVDGIKEKIKEIEDAKTSSTKELRVANGYEIVNLETAKDIYMGKYGGTYSTWTTNTQNKLAQILINLKYNIAPAENEIEKELAEEIEKFNMIVL